MVILYDIDRIRSENIGTHTHISDEHYNNHVQLSDKYYYYIWIWFSALYQRYTGWTDLMRFEKNRRVTYWRRLFNVIYSDSCLEQKPAFIINEREKSYLCICINNYVVSMPSQTINLSRLILTLIEMYVQLLSYMCRNSKNENIKNKKKPYYDV